jgi:hypothetical protein
VGWSDIRTAQIDCWNNYSLLHYIYNRQFSSSGQRCQIIFNNYSCKFRIAKRPLEQPLVVSLNRSFVKLRYDRIRRALRLGRNRVVSKIEKNF